MLSEACSTSISCPFDAAWSICIVMSVGLCFSSTWPQPQFMHIAKCTSVRAHDRIARASASIHFTSDEAGRGVHEVFDEFKRQLPDVDPLETEEWIESLDALVDQA